MDRNSMQCVGRPSEVASKVNERETGTIKPMCATSADPLAKESVEWKPKQQKPKPGGKVEGQNPSINSDTSNPTVNAQSYKRQQKAKSIGKTERQDSSTNSDTTNPTQEEQQTTSEVKLDSGHELQIHPHVVLCDPDPRVEEREEEESEEHETAEGHVPLELFAEFLQAVMTKNYQLSKKLCQMILIYEPQNSEAKNFLPLIEEKLLIETEECLENNDDESDTSDDDDDEEEDDSSDDEDVDDNESSDSCDTDEESTDSTDDTSSSA
ncbi:glutamate-rich protein 2 isoform X4 [Misgurnus anguillicaudatus]|uniref:glutamate-rich protein 2 isoform X4 n=1 Tax=Misgurnus anguillicaudatus TaxID=75329 RepID=UPI003CCFCAE0